MSEGSNQLLAVRIHDGPPIPAGRGGHAGGVVGGRVVVASGSSWTRDRATKLFHRNTWVRDGLRWRDGLDLPLPAVECGFASDGAQFLIVGGKTDPETVVSYTYRLADENGELTCTPFPPLPRPLYGCGAAIAADALFVLGGYDRVVGNPSNRIFKLDLGRADAGWTRCADLPASGRAYPAFFQAGEFLFCAGGMTLTSDARVESVFRDLYRYDPRQDRWRPVAELELPGYCWGAAVLDDERVILAGRADGKLRDDVTLLDLRTGAMRVVAALRQPQTSAPMISVAPCRWWLMGGEPDANRSRTNHITEISIA